jgi:NAD(P)-dependent dehydrogenase (short-subunit alcohol dehydrogenase family)
VKTIAVVGMGPLLGLSVAKRWGAEGWSVAMVSRTQSNLDAYAAELGELGIEAAGFAADVRDPSSLATALAKAKARYGPIHTLYYGPTEWLPGQAFPPLETTVESALGHFELLVCGAITAVRSLLPDMEAEGAGTMLFTTGTSAHSPLPFITSLGIANAGLRHYARCLTDELGEKDVYVGTLSIGVPIARDSIEGDPERIAQVIFEMAEERRRADEIYGSAAPTDWSG